MTRRSFLAAAAAGALAGCAPTRFHLVDPHDSSKPLLQQLDGTRDGGIDLVLERNLVPIAGNTGDAITINGSVPGPTIRMREGRKALIRVHNRLAEPSSIHWHGMIVPFTMDGVPGVSFPGIPPGETFVYEYEVRQSGTYWYHSHSGLQEQLGHYGALIVDPAEPDPVEFEIEHTLVLSDWTFESPHAVLRKLKTIEGYYNFQRPTLADVPDVAEQTGESASSILRNRLAWQRMRMDPTDLADVTSATYTYLMNGRSSEENPTFLAAPNERVRLRIINASAMTYFDFRVPGLPLTVVQADGQNVVPVEVDELRIAVAETYDVLVTMPADRPCSLFAESMDRSGFVCGTLATRSDARAEPPKRRSRPMLTMADMGMAHSASDRDPSHGSHSTANSRQEDEHAVRHDKFLPTQDLPATVRHSEGRHGPGSIRMAATASRRVDQPGVGLGDANRRVLTYSQLNCLETPPDRRPPTRELNLHLTGNMHKYIWGFDGKKWSESEPIRFVYGERLRINFINDTMMSHPIHLHGMWMDVYTGAPYERTPRKHTVNLKPSELLTVDVTVDAPGHWALHCHLLYHMKAGMFRTVAVVRTIEGSAAHEKE